MRDWTEEIRVRLESARYSPVDEALVVEELAQHLDDRYADLVAQGRTPEQASRETLAELDTVGDLGSRLREAHPRSHAEPAGLGAPSGMGLLEARWFDLRQSLRMLRREPLHSGAIILTLALGIGANTGMFTVINAILLRPLPFTEGDRLVMIWETDRASSTTHEPLSWPDLVDFRERSRTLESVGSLIGLETTWVPPGGEAERVSALSVTPDLPGLLGLGTVAGRLFGETEGSAERPVALVSEAFWRRRLHADPEVLGATLLLNGRSTTVVGVLGPEADLGVTQIHARADYSAPWAGGPVDIWVAMEPTAEAFPRWTHPFLTIGRLAPGATVESAQRELAGIAAELESRYPENESRGVNVEPLEDVVFGSTRPILLLLLWAVGLVLLVTCANVANLVLVRAAGRARELTVRVALGARRGRIAMQLLTEVVVLAGLGAALGVLLAYGGVRALIAVAPEGIPRISGASIDGGVLAFTAGSGLLVAIVVGCIPLGLTLRADLQRVLQSSRGHPASEGRAAGRMRSGLVLAQTALAVTLVIGAGLMIRTLIELERVDPGFRAERVLKLEYQLPSSRYPIDFSRWPDLHEINDLNSELLRKVAAIPGIEEVALAGAHPLDPGVTNSFAIPGRESESDRLPEIRTRFVSPSYARTLRTPLIAGRFVEDGDDARATPVAVLNRTAAERYFDGSEPIGQRVRFWGVVWQVVGVIGDERFLGLDREAEPAIYVPLRQAPQSRAVLLVRAAGDPFASVPAIRAALRELDLELALYGIQPLEETLASSVGRPRFTARLLTLFGVLTIVLALVGLHGVLSYTVIQRKPELGIRLALGAPAGSVLRLVLADGFRLAATGVIIGALLALLGSRALSGLLFGVSAADPAVFLVVVVGTLTAAMITSLLPARRATRADPLAVIRAE